MRSFVVLLLVCQLCALPANAGAWMREKGKSFVATSFSATYFYDLTQSTYIEYGLRDNLTLGADIATFHSPFGLQTGSATLFLRFPLGVPTEQGRWAYELGAGASWAGDITVPHLKAGLSWGRGFPRGDRQGWLAVDASLKWDFGLAGEEIKVDTTAGFDFSDFTTGMIQLFISGNSTGASASIAPSLILSPKGGKYRFQIGSEIPVDAPERTSIKFGLWRSF